MINAAYSLFSAATKSCSGGSFLGFPTWYKYLPGQTDAAGQCSPSIKSLGDIWLVVAAILEILLRVAALVAVVFVIYGGISMITSEGDPEKTKNARNTMINALVGLAISVMAAAIITFIAGSIHNT